MGRLHLIRAFVYNPEVMVLNHPVDDLDPDITNTILMNLKEFVENHGLELDAATKAVRRPRTVFLSCGKAKLGTGSQVADSIWTVVDNGIRVEPGQRNKAVAAPGPVVI